MCILKVCLLLEVNAALDLVASRKGNRERKERERENYHDALSQTVILLRHVC
jgi:hypothetical protein